MTRAHTGGSVSPTMSSENVESDVRLLMKYLHNYRILSKSQVPDVKGKKAEALRNLAADMSKEKGVTVEPKKLSKISNLKARVKSKSDLNKTGNKKIKLSPWESELLTLMDYKDNPVFHKIPNAMSVGLPATSAVITSLEAATDDEEDEEEEEAEEESEEMEDERTKPRRRSCKRRRLPQETRETLSMSNSELQRLVLLEQLSYIRLKKRMYLERDAHRRSTVPSSITNATEDPV